MSVIDSIIGPQSFEIVRDRIGRILADELGNQFDLTTDPTLQVNTWVERFLAFDNTELPSVNVMLADGSYGGQTQIQSDGTYRYYVDCYVNAKSSPENPGDSKAMIKLHRLMGVCRAILEDARYKTLGFATPAGFIMNRHIESIQIQNPNTKEHDMLSSVMGRLILSVKVPEVTTYAQPTNATNFKTTVKLADTDKGYLWIRSNIVDPYIFDFSFDSTFE